MITAVEARRAVELSPINFPTKLDQYVESVIVSEIEKTIQDGKFITTINTTDLSYRELVLIKKRLEMDGYWVSILINQNSTGYDLKIQFRI